MTSRILVGHVLDHLAALPDASVHACITSPPYYGLRSYGTEPQVWGGDPACEHGWQHEGERASSPQRDNGPGGGVWNGVTRGEEPAVRRTAFVASRGDTCTRCNAWRGELGQEPTLALFLDHLVQVFREVRRVLRPDGICFINMGDGYANDGKWGGSSGGKHVTALHGNTGIGRQKVNTGLKPKDLMMVPARLALALVDDGWHLRSQMPWLKRNCMPESATDRPTSAIEYVYLLTKRSRYFWDAEAVRRRTGNEMSWEEYEQRTAPGATWQSGGITRYAGANKHDGGHSHPNGRNMRNSDLFYDSLGLVLSEDGDPLALDVNPQPFPGAHFATFPPKLVRPLLLAGTSEHGCCAACGTPWRRVVKRTAMEIRRTDWGNQAGTRTASSGTMVKPPTSETTGWQPGCSCDAPFIPCTVLDPFGGAGTVSLVAEQLGRDSILVELNETYATMAQERIQGAAPLLTTVELIAD